MSYLPPMLAATVKDTAALQFPLWASPKLDGVRCVIKNGRALSRSLKEIPNFYVQAMVSDGQFNDLDGELMVGEPTAPDVFRKTSSLVMSQQGKPSQEEPLGFYVFDMFGLRGVQFDDRQRLIGRRCRGFGELFVMPVHQVLIVNEDRLLAFEAEVLARGYEGVMLRGLAGEYKHGRSTLKEGLLLKLKRFVDSEAIVLNVIELQHNDNEPELQSSGKKKRSTKQAGLSGAGRMGALQVMDVQSKVIFEVGTGFTDADRHFWWAQRGPQGELKSPVFIKYKSFPSGVKDKPRFPVFLGVRDPKDF